MESQVCRVSDAYASCLQFPTENVLTGYFFSRFPQGGPETDEVKHDVYYNQWEDLDDSPIGWHITEAVDPADTDEWLNNVDRNIY